MERFWFIRFTAKKGRQQISHPHPAVLVTFHPGSVFFLICFSYLEAMEIPNLEIKSNVTDLQAEHLESFLISHCDKVRELFIYFSNPPGHSQDAQSCRMTSLLVSKF